MARILVVDDDDEIRSIMRKLLEAEGYDVAEARDGSAALDFMLSAEEPALLVLDADMPVMPGRDLLRLMNTYYRLSRVPVLLLSASGENEALRYPPVRGFVSKPLEAKAFLDTVRICIAKQSGGSSPG